MPHHLVPDFILERHAAAERHGRFPGVALFVDTSGFTPLTARLQPHTTAGAETLANVLLAVFEPLIAAVYAHGGFVAGFAGDAFKAIFPGTDQPAHLAALAAARDIREHMTAHATYSTPYGDFPFAVRTSIASGEIGWGIWQTTAATTQEQAAAYTFSGEAIDAAIRGEALAQAGDVIVTQSVLAALGDLAGLVATPLADGDGYWRVMHLPAGPSVSMPALAPTPVPLTAVTPFYPADLITQTSQGEFRRVLTLFINLQTLPDAEADGPFMTTLFRLLHQYGGYLCRLGRIGALDAGGTLLLFWGAPTSHENDVERVLNFMLDLQAQTAVPCRAGITYQIAYAGFVGSPHREEYTCYGLSVNLAARLMTSAPWGAVWVDEAVAQRAESLFRLAYLEEQLFKGFESPLPVYQLLQRRTAVSDPFFRGKMVGRQQELALLAAAFAPLLDGRFGGIVAISGEAGIGKSRLIHDCLTQTDILETAVLFLCQADEILREPLNPFRYFLRHYFEQSPPAGETANKAAFDAILGALIEDTPDPELQAELNRTRSFLAALVDLHWPDSLYAISEPKLRQENTFSALKSLLKAESLRQPVILQVEDAHWLDDSSRQLMGALPRNLADFPIIVLVTTRDPQLAFSLPDETPQQTISLHSLDEAEVARLATNRLHTAVSPDLIHLLLERTDGNPFFVEQLVIYLQEQQLLRPSAAGVVPVATAVSTLPGDLQAILIARMDQLTQEVRQVVQTAAILGREFDVQVLSHMLRGETALPEKVKTAESAAIWSALSELRYLFKHALLRDAAYDMQLLAQRRQLHQIAAAAITHLHAGDLTPYYADLAYHYRQAALAQEEARYARLAGEAAAAQFANHQALAYLSRALALTTDPDSQFALLLARVQVYALLGRRDDQLADINQLRQLADAIADEQQPSRQAQVALAQTTWAEATSDFPLAEAEAARTVRLAQLSQDKEIETAGRIRWAVSLWRQGRYDEAQDQAEQTLSLARSANLPLKEGHALVQLGNIAYLKGYNEQAGHYYRQSLSIYQNLNYVRGEATAFINLSLVAKGTAPDQARIYIEASMEKYHQMGDRKNISQGLLTIASLDRDLGDYPAALQQAELSLSIAREVGDRNHEVHCFRHLADIYRDLGDYAAAARFAAAELELSREVGNQRSYCFALATNGILLYLQGDNQQAVASQQQSITLSQACGLHHAQAFALIFLGHALSKLGQWDEAEAVYQEGLSIIEVLDEPQNQMELWAGMARLSWARGDLAQASDYVAAIMTLLEKHSLNGAEEPVLVYLTCYQVLAALGDERAAAVLQAGHDFLQQRAFYLQDDAQRQQFLDGVAAHRELEAVYAAMAGSAVIHLYGLF